MSDELESESWIIRSLCWVRFRQNYITASLSRTCRQGHSCQAIRNRANIVAGWFLPTQKSVLYAGKWTRWRLDAPNVAHQSSSTGCDVATVGSLYRLTALNVPSLLSSVIIVKTAGRNWSWNAGNVTPSSLLLTQNVSNVENQSRSVLEAVF